MPSPLFSWNVINDFNAFIYPLNASDGLKVIPFAFSTNKQKSLKLPNLLNRKRKRSLIDNNNLACIFLIKEKKV